MVTWDAAIFHELRVLIIHTLAQSLLSFLMIYMNQTTGFPTGDFMLIIMIIIGFSTVDQDLKVYRNDGPSVTNNMIRTTVNLSAVFLAKFLISLFCSGKVKSDSIFEVNCGLEGPGKFMLLVLFNLLIISLIRTAITGIFFIYQLIESLSEKVMGRWA